MKIMMILFAIIFNFSAYAQVPGNPKDIHCGYDGREGSFSTEYVFHIDLNGQSTYQDLYASNLTWSALSLVNRSQDGVSFKSRGSILTFNFPMELFNTSEIEEQLTFESPYGNTTLSCFVAQ